MSPATDGQPWIGVDRGTSAFRAWRIAPDGSVLDRRRTSRGVNALAPDEFEAELIESVDDWLPPRHGHDRDLLQQR